jgi:hypothetical protein
MSDATRGQGTAPSANGSAVSSTPERVVKRRHRPRAGGRAGNHQLVATARRTAVLGVTGLAGVALAANLTGRMVSRLHNRREVAGGAPPAPIPVLGLAPGAREPPGVRIQVGGLGRSTSERVRAGLSDHHVSETLLAHLRCRVALRERSRATLDNLLSRALVWQKDHDVPDVDMEQILAPTVAEAFCLAPNERRALKVLSSQDARDALRCCTKVGVTTDDVSTKDVVSAFLFGSASTGDLVQHLFRTSTTIPK